MKLTNRCYLISDHVIEDSGFLLHLVCKCLALSWAFQLEIILPDHPISLCLYHDLTFDHWMRILVMAQLLKPSLRWPQSSSVFLRHGQCGQWVWQYLGDTSQIDWSESEDATLHLSISQNIPDAGDHDKLVIEMLQNIQDGMLSCLHKIPKPKYQHFHKLS